MITSQLFPRTQPLFDIIRKHRGWTDEFIKEINNAEHPMLKDMDKLIDVLKNILDKQLKLVVMPDFDMDGITSGTIGFAGFSELGFNVELYVPDYRRGHGFSAADVNDILNIWPDTHAIITCDTGITAFEGIDAAKSKNLTVLVTDHHMETEGRSNADVVIDPSRTDDPYPNKGICGAHVLYQVIEEFTKKHRPEKLHDITWLKLFAGIGTVSDVMPLIYENRQLVRDSITIAQMFFPAVQYDSWGKPIPRTVDPERSSGILLMRQQEHHPVFVSAFEGFAIALSEFVLQGKLQKSESLDIGFYGFYLSPAFNAIRRINTDLMDAFRVFFAPDIDEKRDAMQIIIKNNERRKEMVILFTEDINSRDQPLAPLAWFTDAPAGMLGLLANKIMRETGLPAMVINPEPQADGRVGGSARSPIWFPINTVINNHADLGYIAAGHENACGVSAPSLDEFAQMTTMIGEEVQRLHKRVEEDGTLEKLEACDLTLGDAPDADAGLENTEALIETINEIENFGPYGHGYEEPKIGLAVSLEGAEIKTIGNVKQHVSIKLEEGMKCLWWNASDQVDKLKNLVNERADVKMTGKLSINNYMGKTGVDFIINSLTERAA